MHKVLLIACCAVSMSFGSLNLSNTKESDILHKNGTELFGTSSEKDISTSVEKRKTTLQGKQKNTENKIGHSKNKPKNIAITEKPLYLSHNVSKQLIVPHTNDMNILLKSVKHDNKNISQIFQLGPTNVKERTTHMLFTSNKHDNRNVANSTEIQHNSINITQSTNHGNAKATAKQSFPMLQRIHSRITHSKNAVWATVTLTFMCILLVLSVAQSRMWRDHYYVESQGVPLPNFNERVLFKDVMERKVRSLKQFFKKKSKKSKENETELESLLPLSEWDV